MEVGHQKLVSHPPSSPPQARKDGKIIRFEMKSRRLAKWINVAN